MTSRWSLLSVALLLPSLARADGFAPQGEYSTPGDEIPNIDVVNKIGTKMPTDVLLRDESNKPITFGEAMSGKPTVLVFAYFHCPQLCNQVLTQLVDQMRKLSSHSIGKDFTVLTVSIDPKESPMTAWSWRKQYSKLYSGRDEDQEGWRFLTTKQEQITLLTEAAGFQYSEVAKPLIQPVGSEKKNKEYSHPAVVMILQPDGTISRYLFGLDWTAKELKYALIDSNAELGDFKDKIVMRCFMSYDPHKGRYTMDVWKLTQFCGILTVVLIAFFVVREVRRKPTKPPG